MPETIGALLREDERKDIYGAIVSSQFDADRLDYIQRDRLMTGVKFGHIDLDWLIDCLEVGKVTIGKDELVEAPCLYLGPKGVQVAEEYLEARYRLYRMVYMHKTTRAAEKMLEVLLGRVADCLKNDRLACKNPVLRYFASTELMLGDYLDLDDAAVWSALEACRTHANETISGLACRLRDRDLYKCVDVGVHDKPDGNLFRRFRRVLESAPPDFRDGLLIDDASLAPYKWYDFGDGSALNKVLVKTPRDMDEPVDISTDSLIVKSLQGEKRIQRAYAPDVESAEKLERLLKGMRK